MAPKTLNQDESHISKDLPKEGFKGDNSIEQAMKGLHLVETSEGEKEWELWADEALAFKAEQQWTLENVKAIFKLAVIFSPPLFAPSVSIQ